MHNWPFKHHNQSMGYTIVLSTTQGASSTQEGDNSRTGKDRSVPTVAETLPWNAIASRFDGALGLCTTIWS